MVLKFKSVEFSVATINSNSIILPLVDLKDILYIYIGRALRVTMIEVVDSTREYYLVRVHYKLMLEP